MYIRYMFAFCYHVCSPDHCNILHHCYELYVAIDIAIICLK